MNSFQGFKNLIGKEVVINRKFVEFANDKDFRNGMVLKIEGVWRVKNERNYYWVEFHIYRSVNDKGIEKQVFFDYSEDYTNLFKTEEEIKCFKQIVDILDTVQFDFEDWCGEESFGIKEALKRIIKNQKEKI